MIKLAFITPTKSIKEFGSRGDFTLALSHLMDKDSENEYEKAIKEISLPIILDNGLFENHEPEGLETLVEKAQRVGATHFFAPDILFDANGTRDELKKAVKAKQDTDLKLAAVVQADNREDYLNQLIEFNADPEVDMIGLSILSIPKSYEKEIGEFNVTKARLMLLKDMIDLKEQGVDWKPCHMLGLGDSYQDVIFANKHCPWVVSNDTSSCFQSGKFGKELEGDFLEVPGGKVQEKVDFDQGEPTKDQKIIISRNINRVLSKIKHDNQS